MTSSVADDAELEALVGDGQPPGVHAREVEQIGGELRQTGDLHAHLVEEVLARRRVDPLVRPQQLEEAGEREERRSQLVRRVGDELGAGPVERGEPQPHALERAGKLPELVRRRVG